MAENYKPSDGDHVRVVYEGVVNSADDTGFAFGDKVPVIYDEDKDYLKSIEKIEPPLEVFKDGIVVRRRSGVNEGIIYTLGAGGYISHNNGQNVKYGVGYTRGFFNTENFEWVALS